MRVCQRVAHMHFKRSPLLVCCGLIVCGIVRSQRESPMAYVQSLVSRCGMYMCSSQHRKIGTLAGPVQPGPGFHCNLSVYSARLHGARSADPRHRHVVAGTLPAPPGARHPDAGAGYARGPPRRSRRSPQTGPKRCVAPGTSCGNIFSLFMSSMIVLRSSTAHCCRAGPMPHREKAASARLFLRMRIGAGRERKAQN